MQESSVLLTLLHRRKKTAAPKIGLSIARMICLNARIRREVVLICLRCGYCCHWLTVVIVDNPKLGPPQTIEEVLSEDNNLTVHNGQGVPCQHLRGDRLGEFVCSIHNESWYSQTPCFEYTQIERSPDTPCRRGAFEKNRREKSWVE